MTNTHWTPEETIQLFIQVARHGNLSGAWPSQNNQQDANQKQGNPCGKVKDWKIVIAAMPAPPRKSAAYHSKWSKMANEIYHATAGMTFRDKEDRDHPKDPDHHKLLVRAAALGYMVGPIWIQPRYNAPPPPPGSFPLVPPLAAAEAASAAADAVATAGGSGGRARAAAAASAAAASAAASGAPAAAAATAAPSADQEVAMADMEVDEEYYDDVPAAAVAANPFAAFSSGPAPAPAPAPALAPSPVGFPPPPRWPDTVELGGPYLDHIMQFPWDWRQEYRRALQEELDELDRREGEVQFNEFL
ncbi:hypothetical protein PFICI_08155 [Pestalotiopsis fici W106-1]|uniref:Uncharacterized protein n=1 Tax=Pestalotiopsis fici (strain W106-1 / CGMCC3.15140) TaxID=1229662 RepID=W3X629_PESFW|nr:uncharacterized protein PFICI_08155 [Pestalotiopsis fici W106-1]ETS80626.1 hypothetical protein PFICI_08155 [Pestalotiopsis fici W106-1]